MSELVDLSKLDAPKVLEDLDFETLLAERKKNSSNYLTNQNVHSGSLA